MEPEAETPAEPMEVPTKEVRRRKKQLYGALRRQMEFYFSDANLTKNRIMGQRVLEDPNVDLKLFLTFNKIRALTMNVDDIAKALKKSDMLAVTEDGTKVYRTTPIRKNANVDQCTIYVENLPPDAEHEWLKSVFLPYGTVPYVSIPKFNVSRMNKGFAFVELESPDAVKRALEAFDARGCLIPTQMPHEQLSSIANFDEKRLEKKLSKIEAVDMFEEEAVLIKNETETEGTITEESAVIKKEDEEQKPLKKRKIEEEVEENVNDKEEKVKHPKKRKNRNSKSSEVGDSVETKDGEEGEKTNEEEMEKSVEKAVEGEEKENEGEGEEERKKKKSRRHKKKNKKEPEEVDPKKCLRILPKLEWKRLRNKYLSLQKSKMIELKQHLSRSRWGGNYSQEPRDPQQNHLAASKQEEGGEGEKPAIAKQPATTKRFSFVPGVIVAINLGEPVSDVKSFKTEARSHPNVLYVDLEEGGNEAFVRCSSTEDARSLLASRPWADMSVLDGQAETDYWDKITRDREQKMKGTLTKQPKKRGRDKLLKKAEKALGKHIRFDEHE